MDRREEFSVYFTDQFEALLFITKPNCIGHRVKRIVKNPLPERQWQMMLFPVDRILGWIIFEINV
tara:strand:+ start:24170 stop:24364 length:195 start_codon:yes stop_codon:yes gene_type:complete